jgi:hypothetical protein
MKDTNLIKTILEASNVVILHVNDWNWRDRAYEVEENYLKKMKKDILDGKNIRDIWKDFINNSKATVGIEDADFFLDYTNPKESASDWEF